MTLLCPKGFYYSGIHAGLKDSKQELDLALIYSDTPCKAAAVFTQNHFPGEPVKLARQRVENGQLQAIIANSKISNVATGEQGYRDAENICKRAADHLNLDESDIVISSTGIIGRPYPEGVIQNHLEQLIDEKGSKTTSVELAAKAIMTTDTRHKARSLQMGEVTITVIAKGAGMIDPNMATMLAFITCDGDPGDCDLKALLKRVVDKSFNCISVDFDTSTSDSVFLLCNGKQGTIDPNKLENALEELCLQSAKDLVADGEGVDKTIDCLVKGAKSQSMADAVARSIINSPLVKTMITGADPNWGRIIMAIGKVDREPDLSGVQPSISICHELVFSQGKPCDHDEQKISHNMKALDTSEIVVDLHLGDYSARHFGANLSKDYVSINADYTS